MRNRIIACAFVALIFGGHIRLAWCEEAQVEHAVCTVDTAETIFPAFAEAGFTSMEEACLSIGGEFGGNDFAAMQAAPAIQSAVSIGVLKCIMEWCGIIGKKADDAPLPKTRPKVEVPGGKPDTKGPKLPPEIVEQLEKKTKRERGIGEEGIEGPYVPAPPSRPKIDEPQPRTKPNDTSGEEVIGTADLMEFEKYLRDKQRDSSQ